MYILADKKGNVFAKYEDRVLAESVYVEAILFRDLIIIEEDNYETNS